MSGDALFLYDYIRDISFPFGEIFGRWTIVWVIISLFLLILFRNNTSVIKKTPLEQGAPKTIKPAFDLDDFQKRFLDLENAISTTEPEHRFAQYQFLLREYVLGVYDLDLMNATYDTIGSSNLSVDMKNVLIQTYYKPYSFHHADEHTKDLPMQAYIDTAKRIVYTKNNRD